MRSQDNQTLVAFVDGSDVFWGGCALSSFLGSYRRIANASGAAVVVSAETACGEQPCREIPRPPRWAERLAGKNLSDGFWTHYLSKEREHELEIGKGRVLACALI